MAKCLRFIKPLENYALNDTASFDDKLAAKIIEKGFAKEVPIESTKLKKTKEDEK